MGQPLAEQLRGIAATLHELAEYGNDPEVEEPLKRLEEAAAAFEKSWSGSNLGFHASVYYAGFEVPPPGAHFSSEWGFLGTFQGTTGEWQEYQHDEVVDLVRKRAGNPDVAVAEGHARAAREALAEARPEIISVLAAYLASRSDDLIDQLKIEAEQTRDLAKRDVARAQLPSGALMSRDTTALTQGLRTAPHQEVLAEVLSLRSVFAACASLGDVASRAANHMDRLVESQAKAREATSGSRVFIGHGQSPLWRELKDFLSERLGLEWDEFNRIPVAGVTNIARLSEMLDAAGIAFLVLTAEDETVGGRERARQNVVHEAGLFQGRLGFSRAIIVLEEGCEEFSNIQGLGQVRFPTSRIDAAFEEVRRVLEREGFLAG